MLMPCLRLVTMIELSRQYEMHIKVMKAAEEADQSSCKATEHAAKPAIKEF